MTRPAAPALPVASVLEDLAAALRGHRRVVLVAPPGSGKTTLVPPFLLASGLCPSGEIVVLQPRRVAARTVARRIAAGLGERVGERVGYQVRFDTVASHKTRIRVVTEGILTAWLQRDPELRGVAAVVLDELHERSLHADLALALVREVQEALREDLLLVVMSATLDAAPVAAYLGGCPVVSSDGRLHPVAVSHLPRAAEGPVAEVVAAGVLAMVDGAPGGDVLVFLPGVREIEAARGRLTAPLASRGWDTAVLHGRLDPAAQDAALDPGPRPRAILATNLAETSLTIAGVAAVVDSGLAKVMRFEAGLGSGRLTTERISRASADQRAGRAGRLGPGRALRLWTVHDERTMAAFDDPEIRRVDLTGLVLELRAWGVADPAAFPFFEAPEPERLAAAEATLKALGAIDPVTGGLSRLGLQLRRVPASPRVAAFLVAAAEAAIHDKRVG
ncbi:MAG: ATP-dependent helicase HrpB, partial [Deltaproteobacteria bacterium HGW-Deltaproteobacteria-14]